MSNSHLKMQEIMLKEIKFHLEENYHKILDYSFYNKERITKFNFEQVVNDQRYLNGIMEMMCRPVYQKYKHQMTDDEKENFFEMASDFIYTLIDEDIYKLRESEKQYE